LTESQRQNCAFWRKQAQVPAANSQEAQASASQNFMAVRAARALRNINAAWRLADGNPRLNHSRCT
ncbi:MAG: hypothetical protein WBD11_16440, partial [Xanthobacteraceae bacterium]